jgi:hypothetical protein
VAEFSYKLPEAVPINKLFPKIKNSVSISISRVKVFNGGTMESAIFGLVGVVLGVLLSFAKEWWLQSRKTKKDADYLSIQIICMLDRYVAGCAEVAMDDGKPDKDGYCRAQVVVPRFEPDAAKVDWKSLPTNLMYEVLTLPSKIEAANNRVDGAFEFAATPPDFSEGFDERQLQYAKLGIEAAELSNKLRKLANFPIKSTEEWDALKNLKEILNCILNHRAELDKRHSIMLSEIQSAQRQSAESI